jgi:hypothetical protein
VAHSIRKNLLGGLPIRFWFLKGWATLHFFPTAGGWPRLKKRNGGAKPQETRSRTQRNPTTMLRVLGLSM